MTRSLDWCQATIRIDGSLIASTDLHSMAERAISELADNDAQVVQTAATDILSLTVALLAAWATDLPLVVGGAGIPTPVPAGKSVRVGTVVTRAATATCRLQDRRLDRGAARTVRVHSSGTTGTPRARDRTWDEVGLPAMPPEASRIGEAWGIGYRLDTFAGVHATCSALARAARLEQVTPAMLAHPGPSFDVLCGTPTFWRLSLMQAATHARAGALRYAVLGGEASNEGLLREISRALAPARIRQIYASAEFGILAVAEGVQAGFSAADLSAMGGRVIIADTGQVLARDASGTHRDTGDSVRRTEDRVEVVRRDTRVANVGGEKVDLWEVDRVLKSHPHVLDAQTYALTSVVVGEVVAARVVTSPSAPAHIERLIKDHARATLPPRSIPRKIEIVDELPYSESLKALR